MMGIGKSGAERLRGQWFSPTTETIRADDYTGEFQSFIRGRGVPVGGFALSFLTEVGRIWTRYLIRETNNPKKLDLSLVNVKHIANDPLSHEIPPGFEGVPIWWFDGQT